MDLEIENKFTCTFCCGHRLLVTHTWSVLAGNERERWQEWGLLFDNHNWQYEVKERLDKDATDEAPIEDLKALERKSAYFRLNKIIPWEKATNRGGDEYYVNCENCFREVVFGWSKPDRRGLIMPAELTDFNPNVSWPDPKYLTRWGEKGWNLPLTSPSPK